MTMTSESLWACVAATTSRNDKSRENSSNPNHVFGQIFIERLDQRQPFEATVNVSNDDVPDSDPDFVPDSGIFTV